jgi:hypothetical protein
MTQDLPPRTADIFRHLQDLPRRPNESRAVSAGSRIESDEPGA